MGARHESISTLVHVDPRSNVLRHVLGGLKVKWPSLQGVGEDPESDDFLYGLTTQAICNVKYGGQKVLEGGIKCRDARTAA